MNRGWRANEVQRSTQAADAVGIMVLFRDDGMEMERFLPRLRRFL